MNENGRKIIYGLLVIAIVSLFCDRNGCTRREVRSDTVMVTRVDTMWRTDTVPVVKSEKVVSKVILTADGQLLTENDWKKQKNDRLLTKNDSRWSKDDSLLTKHDLSAVKMLDVVQREYADSNYTAWVSGVAVDSAYPRLDSIRVQERVVTRETTINNTITVKKKT